MFGFKSNKKSAESSENTPDKSGVFASLRSRLGKTRQNLTHGLADLFLGSKTLDDGLLEELEDLLLMADVGMETTQKLSSSLAEKLQRKDLKNGEAVYQALREDMLQLLLPCQQAMPLDSASPFVILMVGINGAGKTTTIGKLAQQFHSQGKSVMLAAGDTFRAAAVEQLQGWGQRLNIPVIAQGSGADSASVIYDAYAAARSRGADILIADTAGRLHTQSNLMEELAKVKRVLAKLDPAAPHETLLVLDAGTGQNALSQATEFHQKAGLSGITLTKLDGTAKGGIVFAIANQLQLPIRYLGVGEAASDLRPFDAADFVEALLSREAP